MRQKICDTAPVVAAAPAPAAAPEAGEVEDLDPIDGGGKRKTSKRKKQKRKTKTL